MTVQLTAVETVSDALFTCSYLWAHGKQYSRSDLDKALHQHKDPTTPVSYTHLRAHETYS